MKKLEKEFAGTDNVEMVQLLQKARRLTKINRGQRIMGDGMNKRVAETRQAMQAEPDEENPMGTNFTQGDETNRNQGKVERGSEPQDIPKVTQQQRQAMKIQAQPAYHEDSNDDDADIQSQESGKMKSEKSRKSIAPDLKVKRNV